MPQVISSLCLRDKEYERNGMERMANNSIGLGLERSDSSIDSDLEMDDKLIDLYLDTHQWYGARY